MITGELFINLLLQELFILDLTFEFCCSLKQSLSQREAVSSGYFIEFGAQQKYLRSIQGQTRGFMKLLIPHMKHELSFS